MKPSLLFSQLRGQMTRDRPSPIMRLISAPVSGIGAQELDRSCPVHHLGHRRRRDESGRVLMLYLLQQHLGSALEVPQSP